MNQFLFRRGGGGNILVLRISNFHLFVYLFIYSFSFHMFWAPYKQQPNSNPSFKPVGDINLFCHFSLHLLPLFLLIYCSAPHR